MHISSVQFVKGVVGTDSILNNGVPQIAFIGRSNVGKSSIINSLTKQKQLARVSSFPGRTQEINVFLINKAFYLIDLPGYGYAKTSREGKERLQKLIHWYLIDSPYEQKKIVFIIDAFVGVTNNDLNMLHSLAKKGKDIVVVANKVDKIKNADYDKQMQTIQDMVGDYTVIPYSAKKNVGINELAKEMLS